MALPWIRATPSPLRQSRQEPRPYGVAEPKQLGLEAQYKGRGFIRLRLVPGKPEHVGGLWPLSGHGPQQQEVLLTRRTVVLTLLDRSLHMHPQTHDQLSLAGRGSSELKDSVAVAVGACCRDNYLAKGVQEESHSLSRFRIGKNEDRCSDRVGTPPRGHRSRQGGKPPLLQAVETPLPCGPDR
ncbi:hypothetical protein TREES_T100013848 [Tupaia chinensis]|uniref:Uncharacterized protein n=1 Tax=Tupaia chinensis TaxID=246437 RepID=L9KZ65_TUPCH|nr:hypothetical protein TREES_T100013848 [Tupaia chinensis]